MFRGNPEAMLDNPPKLSLVLWTIITSALLYVRKAFFGFDGAVIQKYFPEMYMFSVEGVDTNERRLQLREGLPTKALEGSYWGNFDMLL